MSDMSAEKKPAACLSGIGLQRASTAGSGPDASVRCPCQGAVGEAATPNVLTTK
jgi:hypothetical protein